MEKLIEIDSSDGVRLEGWINMNSQDRAVIICHPHPLYGGNMDNTVVTTIARVFDEKGITTLRFNFRGVGNSTGEFGEGIGESDDVLAAIKQLVSSGFREIILAGYSFGARINAQVVSSGCADVADHIMVSPPVGFMIFDDIDSLSSTGLVICGEFDEYAPVFLIQDHIRRWKISPRLEIIKGSDHFYSSGLGTLKKILEDYLS